MKWSAGYRRIAAIMILILPHIFSLVGHPIAGADLAPVVNGISDLAAAALTLWSKVRPSTP